MRPVELVVKYLEGQPLPDDRAEWAGVFLASDEPEVEAAFTQAEPPAHDTWEPKNLRSGPARTFVNVALNTLKRRADELGQTATLSPEGGHPGPPLARAAGLMGRFLAGTTGDGGSHKPSGRPPRTGRQRRRPTASKPLFVRLEHSSNGTVAVFRTTVCQDAHKSGLALRAIASVVMDGKKIADSSVAQQPVILSFHGSRRTLAANGNELILNGAAGDFDIRVRMSEHAAASVEAWIETETVT